MPLATGSRLCSTLCDSIPADWVVVTRVVEASAVLEVAWVVAATVGAAGLAAAGAGAAVAGVGAAAGWARAAAAG